MKNVEAAASRILARRNPPRDSRPASSARQAGFGRTDSPVAGREKGFSNQRDGREGVRVFLRRLILAFVCMRAGAAFGDGAASRPVRTPAAPPPAVSAVDQAFLVNAARRAVESAAAGPTSKSADRADGSADVAYVPPALRELRCRVFVTLRDAGNLAAIGQAEPGPVVAGVVAAAERAVQAATAKASGLSADRAGRCSIEIELPGPDERVGDAADSPEQLAGRYEPGFDGILARIGDKDVFVRPSQLLAREPSCSDGTEPGAGGDRYRVAIETLLFSLGLAPAAATEPTAEAARPRGNIAPRDVEFRRYRTRHFWQARRGERPVELVCGLRPVRPEDVTASRLDEAIRRTAEHILYRQQPEGLFAYEYLPGCDRYVRQDTHWVRQATSIWAAAVYARASGDAAARECADKAIEAMRQMTRPWPAAERALYVATPDRQNKLGATALFGLALLDAPEPVRYRELVTALGDAVKSLQGSSGRFAVNFASVPESPLGQEFSPGEALLFLARLYEEFRDVRWREPLDRALPYYRSYHREAAGASFAAWQIQAYGRLARSTLLNRYADFVFEMADRLAATQLRLDATTADEAVALLYDGGLDPYGQGRPGIETAPYVEGLIEALRTARAFRDPQRADRYAAVIRRAVRPVLQLQFKPEEAFYVRSPADALYGFRLHPFESAIRIDSAQHAMFVLMGARQLLWPEAAR